MSLRPYVLLLLLAVACSSAAAAGEDAPGRPPAAVAEVAEGGAPPRDATAVEAPEAPEVLSTHVYGKSAVHGEPLTYAELTPGRPNGKKALLTFGLHGFEDAWDHDGYALEAVAQKLVARYAAASDDLQGWTLYIVPTANPDGMRFGENNAREGATDANGRCTADGKDINRNFSTAAFAEHDALESLVDTIAPTVILDFHGWYNCTYGDTTIGQFFARAFNAAYEGKPSRYCFVDSRGVMDCGAKLGVTFHRNASITHDLFAEWATSKRGIPAVLVELPAPDFDGDGKYDVVRRAGVDHDEIAPRTLDLLGQRTAVALDDLFAHYGR